MLNSLLTTESTKRGSSVTSSRFAPTRPQLLMNPTANTKPKAKFSSRNLSAVFKAPLRTKPLPDNATGPLQRPNSRMLVLGRAAVAPPAPLNTPSLKKESQVHDVRVSLVPASSNWAESTEKELNPEADETPPASADVVASTVNPEEVWTPESVAEHLHTASVPVCPKVMVESSGRWGDDAVEHDIVQNNIRRQKQKDREFPGLKEAAEDAQMHHSQGHAPATDNSSSMEQPEQHHGRATGRWAHFNEQQTYRPLQDDRWFRDRYGQRKDDRWSRDRYRRDEEHRWARDRYSRDDDDRWSHGRWSRHDDGYRREQRPFEASNNVVLPVPNDRQTHFSQSDARFDVVAFGDRDLVLSHSPHRMDWNSGRFGRRDEHLASPAHQKKLVDSRAPQPNRFLTQFPVSPSPVLKSPPMAPSVAPARAMKWSNLSSPDHGSGTAWENSRPITNVWSKCELSSTPVAEMAESSTESSSNSSTSCTSSPPQQLHLLKRPKLLFDPKTGGMVIAEGEAGPGKRQAGDRGGDNRDASTTSESIHAAKNSDGKPEADNTAKPVEIVQTEDTPTAIMLDNTSTSSAIIVNSVQVDIVQNKAGATKTSSSVSSNAVLVTHTAEGEVDVVSKKGRNRKRTPVKHSAGREADSIRDSRSTNVRNTQQGRHNRDFAADAPSRTSSTKVHERIKRSNSTRSDRRNTGGNKPSQHRSSRKVELMPTQQSKADSSELALFKQIAEGSSESVVVLTSEQEGIAVSREESGFETVKSQRFVLSEKKLLRQRLESMEATAQKADEKNSILALVEGHNDCQSDGQSKGEEVQKNFSMATQVVDTQPTSKSRRKTTTSHRGRDNVVQTTKDKKTKFKQTKQSAQTSGPKAKEYKQVPAKTAVESEKTSHTKMKQPVSPAKPTGQVAGEAPAESPISKKRPQYVKVASTTDTQRGQKPRSEKQPQGNSTRDQKASFSSATGSKRTQTHSNRQGAALTADSAERVKKALPAKPRDRVAKARSKQVRQVYVVKTPAPSTASSGAMSTAA